MRLFLCLLSLLAAAPLQAAAKPKPLIYCSEASPEGFDPGLWDSASTNAANKQIFQGLVAFRRGSTEIVPALASRWQMAPDAKSLTFTLRPGVKFHTTPDFKPSRTLNADDVIFTFGRFLDPEHPFNKTFPASFIYPQNIGLARMVEGMDRLDDMTVRFRLRAPDVTFLSYFAMAFAGIHSAEYAGQLLARGQAALINQRPVGTGPYRFKSYTKDEALRLQAHPDYWRQRQQTEQLIFSVSREPNVRVHKLLAGECQISSPLRDIDVGVLDGRSEVTLMKIQALNISYLAFNLSRSPTNRREVREALDIAIDRNAIFKALFPRGDAMQAVSAFPPAVLGYDKTLKNEYNPARARELLAQAGYGPGQGLAIELWALPVSRPTNPNGQLMAQLIQQDWARIGVKATIKTYEWGEYLKRANRGEHDVYMSGWGGETGDADEFLSPNLSCAANKNGVKFCNPDFDRLITEARGSTDPQRRIALYQQAQQLFKRERPWITMAHSTVYIPVRKDVVGFIMSPNGSVDFEGVYRR
ncbi:ABC transporter substrate-binding protein [Paucibacter sp. APW11]|uniref:ABC transporter substrate-binding protein n=1 Tax=Roseateles aquae TaxID=3077235 RepID=A0ABU3PIC5_9BURK|nr:ABC transporter substrate-binding protein [Paucibacter sp. APW11]MDT9001858.1 ABC transporter substrate-binding protein [Paucibacter sp. APW11]